MIRFYCRRCNKEVQSGLDLTQYYKDKITNRGFPWNKILDGVCYKCEEAIDAFIEGKIAEYLMS